MATGDDASFTVDVRREADRVVVAPEGELDIATVPRLAEVMRSHDNARSVVLDLRALRFLDTSGLRAVIDEERRAGAEGRRFAIVRGPVAVQRVFELAGVADRLPFVAEGT
jgi:anti-anti-sigma factor